MPEIKEQIQICKVDTVTMEGSRAGRRVRTFPPTGSLVITSGERDWSSPFKYELVYVTGPSQDLVSRN